MNEFNFPEIQPSEPEQEVYNILEFNPERFLYFSRILYQFIYELDVYVCNCQHYRNTGVVVPTHHLMNFTLLIYDCYEQSGDEYIAMWDQKIIECESDSSAIADYEFPLLENTGQPTEMLGMHRAFPTAHAYSARLLATICLHLTNGLAESKWEIVEPEVVNRLMRVRFSDLQTLPRVAARIRREQAIFARTSQVNTGDDTKDVSTPRKYSKRRRKDTAPKKKVDTVVSALVLHHQPDGDWNDKVLSLEEIMEKAKFGSISTASRAVKFTFGQEGMEAYKSMITHKTLANFLLKKLDESEVTPQGFHELHEHNLVDPITEEIEDDEMTEE